MPAWIEAFGWGLLGGVALLIGAAVGYFIDLPPKVVATVMAFGAGVLIAALSFELMQEAYDTAGIRPAAFGFLAGAAAYVVADAIVSSKGAAHRKRSGEQQQGEHEHGGSGVALAVGALLDGIPESIVIGVSLIGGAAVSAATVAAVFLSNLPEGLSSAAGMRRNGRSPGYVFGVWGAIALASGLAAVVGYTVFDGFSDKVIAATNAVAGGAILAMVTDTMLPEAVENGHALSGLVAAAGFVAGFAVSVAG